MKKINAGYALYIVALGFTTLNLFLQVLPINTSAYFEEHLSLTANQVISINAVFFVFYALMQIPGGLVFDKFGLKIILPLGLFLTLAGSVLYMVCSNGFWLGISRGLTGLGSSIAYISGIYIAVKCFSEQRLSFFIGLVEASATLGAIVAAKTFHQIMQSFGWQMANMMIIIFSAILLVLAVIFGGGIKHESTAKLGFAEILRQVIGLFKRKVLVLLFIYSFFTWSIIMSFAGYWLKNYMIFMHHYSEADALNLVSVYWASFLVGGLIVGFFSKNIKQCKIVIIILAIIGFLNFAIFATPALYNYPEMIALAVIGGVSATGVILAFTLISDIVEPELSGTAIAVNNTFIVVGGLAGQVVFGVVMENLPANTLLDIPTGIDPHYYSAVFLYPVFTFIAMAAVIAALVFSKKKVV